MAIAGSDFLRPREQRNRRDAMTAEPQSGNREWRREDRNCRESLSPTVRADEPQRRDDRSAAEAQPCLAAGVRAIG